MNKLDELKQLYDKLGEIVKANEVKTVPIKGKWYKQYILCCDYKFPKDYVLALFTTFDGKHNLGFSCKEEWQEVYFSDSHQIIEATPEEIKEALVKEAEKRGFKEGVRFKFTTPNAMGNTESTVQNRISDGRIMEYDNSEDGLYSNKGWIYRQGQWADIVKPQPIFIGSYEVTFKNNAAYINEGCYIKSFWKDCKRICDNCATVCLHGVTVPIETINRIIERLEA